jgi:hypothetical protein
VNFRFSTSVVTSLVVATAFLLTACQSSGPEPTTAPPAPIVSSATPTPTASQPEGDYFPFEQDCADLIPNDVVFAFNPNYVFDESATPAAGSSFDMVKTLEGTNCTFINQSSGATLTVSVAHPTATSKAILEEQTAVTLAQVDLNGVPGYFGKIAGSGIVQVFTSNNYWVIIAGPEISTTEDVASLLNAVLSYLPAG